MWKMLLLRVLLLSLNFTFYSVDSCSTVSEGSVSLTGVCPNDTFIVPIGTGTFEYSCTFNSNGSFQLYWNVSGDIINSFVNPLPSGIGLSFANNNKTVLTIATNTFIDIDIQCGLCPSRECFPDDLQKFVGTESIRLIAFGPPSSLSHELKQNDTVKLSWLPPLAEAVLLFTYNIIIMESTNNSLIVTDINITNNTYVIISPADITNYTECTSYQWGVRAAVNLSYGFTDVTMATENFTLISGPKISDELIAIDDNYTIEFNVTAPCDIDLLKNYTYIFLPKDYCQMPLNSSQINVSIPLDDNVVLPNMLISIHVNIGSLIHDSTWSVAVNVSNRFGSDTIDYTNVTNNSEIIQNCNPIISSSVSQVSSLDILSSLITYTVFPISTSSFSFPTPVTPSGESRSGWTSTDTTLVVFGGGLLVCIAVVIYVVMCKRKNNRTSCDIRNVVNKVKNLKVNDTCMVVESPRITVKSSPVGAADIVDEDYNDAETSFQTHLATPDSELVPYQYADLDEIRSRKAGTSSSTHCS